MIKKLCISVILYTVAGVCLAANESSATLAIYQKSALAAQVDSIPYQVRRGFRSQGSNIGAQDRLVRKTIDQKLDSAYSKTRFKNQIMYSLKQLLSNEEESEILAWLDSPLGRKITAIEILHAKSKKHVERPSAINQVKSAIDQDRLVLVKTLDQALMATESAIDVAVNSGAAIAYAALASNATAGAHHYHDLLRVVATQQSEKAAELHHETLEQLKYTYRDLSDEEMQKLISFAMSPAGTLFTVGVQRGITNAFLDGSSSLGDDLALLLTDHRNP